VSPSLADAKGFVTDAFAVNVSAPFHPENIVLGVYTFLPWVRTGIAAAVQNPPSGATRAGVTVSLAVQGPGVADQPVSKQLLVRGPGDVLAFDERHVVRRYPQPGSTNAEDAFLAHVEFDRPDFPWLFSPQAPAGDQLRPWIALVVARMQLAEIVPGSGGLPPRLRTVLGELQPIDADAWAWAHAQILGPGSDSPPPTVDDRLSSAYGVANLSRLLCPRSLDQNESYVACVVPTYDAGVAAGLGHDQPGTLDPAWRRSPDGSDAGNEIELPCYHSWQFQTGPDGDFGSLATKLVPRAAPWGVGRRILDASRPGGNVPDLGAADPGRLQVMKGPLISPAEVPPAGAPSETAAWPPAETEALRTELNLPDQLASEPGALTAEQLPRIAPPIYGQHQAGVTRADPARDGDWLGQLNLKPTNRVAAGLGTRVVEKDREALMQSAWAQVGAIEGANQQLRRAQLARFAGASLHRRHLQPLRYGDLLQTTRRTQARISVEGSLTVHAQIEDSSVAPAAVTASFRRATRPLGPLARYTAGAGRAQLAGIVARGGVARNFQRPYQDPDGVSHVSDLAARALDPAAVASVLQVGPLSADAAAAAVQERGSTIGKTSPCTDQLAAYGAAPVQLSEGVDPAALGADAVLSALRRSAPEDAARATSYVNLLTALQDAGGPAAAEAARLADRLTSQFGLHRPVLGGPPIALAPVAPGALPSAPGVRPRLVAEPASAAFVIESHGDRLLSTLSSSAGVHLDAVSAAMALLAAGLVGADWPGTPALPALSVSGASMLAELDPALTVTRRVKARVGAFPPWLRANWFDDGLVQPIMAAPAFTRPMYEALDDYDRNWLIPGLAELPEPDLVTLLETNVEFIEGFLVGLSHEFARKLLWRGYPTDQRGTYFRRFWNAARDELVPDIYQFGSTPLGNHIVLEPTPPVGEHRTDLVVLLVRGELIRRYPEAIVLALRARDWGKPPVFADAVADPTSMATILFHGQLPPDGVLVGFDLTPDDVLGQPWWFIVAEHPTAPRFGRPSADASAGGLGSDAAKVAHTLLHEPIRAAFEGKPMMQTILAGP
jgi:hypothetical protein